MANKPKKLKDYETAVRTQVECEEKAFHIVNRLIDDLVEGSYLIQCGQLISRQHYKDVVEERAISRLCGYPLCNKTLADIPKKQYHISTTSNRVYDITERKNFCSNQCLKASKFFLNQISESPLWSRNKEPPVEFQLLPHTGITGLVGEEVVGVSPKKLLEEEIKKLQELDIRTEKNQTKSQSLRRQRTLKTPSSPASSGVVLADQNNISATLKQSESDPRDTSNNTAKTSVPQCTMFVPAINMPTEQELNVDNKASKENTMNGDNGKILNGDKGSGNVVKIQSVEGQACLESEPATSMKSLDPPSDVAQNQSSTPSLPTTDSPPLQIPVMADETAERNEQMDKMNLLMRLLSKKKAALSGMIEVMTTTPSTTQVKSANQVLVDSNSETVNHNSSNSHHVNQNSPIDSLPNESFVKPSKAKKKPSSATLPRVVKSPLEKIGVILKSWITENTTNYLYSHSTAGKAEELVTFSNPRVQKGYADLCQRLDAQQTDFERLLEDAPGKKSSTKNPSRSAKSVPDYDALKKEAEAFQLKVTEFLTGRAPEKVATDQKDNTEKDLVYIPTVDIYDQQQIRIKIVLDRLDKFLPDLLIPLRLSVQDISSLVRELTYTFRLDKENIVFKPTEWTLVAMFILKMLSKKSKGISAAFAGESASRYFTVLLNKIGHSKLDLDRVTEEILGSS